MKRFFLCIVIFGLLVCCTTKAPLSGYDFVNPFIGTGGHGHTFPGPTLPFGMVQVGPDTRLTGWDGCSGYHNTDSIIYGFSHTHLSGTGISDYGDVLLMPFHSNVEPGIEDILKQKLIPSQFIKSKEEAKPGYYAVYLEKPKVSVELTATKRVGIHKYTFKHQDANRILLDLNHRDKVLSSKINVESATAISGYRQSQAWATNQYVYFYMEFSEPLINEKISNSNETDLEKYRILTVPSNKHELVIKVGISAVSIEGAKKNLQKEAEHWDFETYVKSAKSEWEKGLNKIKVTDDDIEKKHVFYTALYHSMIAPNTFSDVDGKYRGLDQNIHQDSEQETYTVFSLWDTFRAAHPLFTIIEQERTNAFLNTFLKHYEQGTRLPVWELAANETDCMIGYHSIPVIADAYFKGIRDFDYEKALEAMIHSAELDHFGLASYKKNGVIYAEDESESVSKTLEYAYDDWCIAQFAKALGDTLNYEKFSKRAQYFKNSYDSSTGFMRARTNGGWYKPFDPTEVNFNYTEANSWQYSLFAPHDINGLVNIMGGAEAFDKHLDELFSTSSETKGRHQADITGMIGQYAHGNEPSHHMAYLYNYIGKPWKTQERVQEIINTQYWNGPDGLSGNEDCGQMSAWYVLSAMGFYSVTPGTDTYIIGSPAFEEVRIHLENGNTFTIKTNNRSTENIYIESALLNGEPYTNSFITHDNIIQGGELVFNMGNLPGKEFGITTNDRPRTGIDKHLIVPNPAIETEKRTFSDSLKVSIQNPIQESEVYYAFGNGNSKTWKKYSSPFYISNSTTIHAMAKTSNGNKSFVVTGSYFKVDANRSIVINANYDNQYAADGDKALIDGIRGNNNFKTGVWQGYQGQDVEAIVDLGAVKNISAISTGFLQDIKSWIWYPQDVKYSISNDGVNFKPLAQIANQFDTKKEGAFITTFEAKKSVATRYVKMQAKNIGKCPEWHPGAGGDTWLFIDEITIK